MKLTLAMQLSPAAAQRPVLFATMERFNAAASFAAKAGFDANVFSRPSIHKLVYYQIRERFGLSAQMAVRAIGKAAEVFGRDKTRCPSFRPHGAITYDERILSFKGLDRVSLWTLSGRMILPLIYGEYQSKRFDRIKGQCDLVYRCGKFYLYAIIDLPEDAPVDIKDFLGIDLGIVNLATDSDGKSYTGDSVERVRRRYQRNRNGLQKRGTKGAKKRLKRLAGREARFRRHENHVISKAIVATAKGTDRGIGLEDLTHIRDRITVKAKQRAKHRGWAFSQLRSFIEYKGRLAGVPVVIVDPRDTSRTCSACGHCDSGNRRKQAEFVCLACGHSMDADHNAALNLRVRAWGVYRPPPDLAVDDSGWNPDEISRKSYLPWW